MSKREKVLYFDCFSGISGDMALGAFIDLGMPEELLRSELGKLGLDGWALRASRASRRGIAGTKVDVELADDGPGRDGDHQHCGDDSHEHEHEHEHEHVHEHVQNPDQRAENRGHDGCHRPYRAIKAMIEGSALLPGAKRRALSIFARLASAEAKIHGVAVEEVEFHEVGALDSIIDIVGAAICLEHFSPDRVLCSRIELGGGSVKCQHGLLPVPAPAVVELLAGAPVKSGLVQMETTTPTGAAILAACVDEFTEDRRFTIARSSYGIGHRDPAVPNVLRLFLGEGEAQPAPSGIAPEAGVVLECNVDDMSPELQGYLFERFLKAGASDVWLTPIVMKKSRPAITISVLCEPEMEGAIARLLVEETSTFGFRRYAVDKFALDRRAETVETSLGAVRVKSALFEGAEIKSKPEYEDLKRIAEERGMPLRLVQERVLLELGSIDKAGVIA